MKKDDTMKEYFGNTEKLEEEVLSPENVDISYSLVPNLSYLKSNIMKLWRLTVIKKLKTF